jgi:hypothetical protein
MKLDITGFMSYVIAATSVVLSIVVACDLGINFNTAVTIGLCYGNGLLAIITAIRSR